MQSMRILISGILLTAPPGGSTHLGWGVWATAKKVNTEIIKFIRARRLVARNAKYAGLITGERLTVRTGGRTRFVWGGAGYRRWC